MIGMLVGDAAFCVAVCLETLALLSILKTTSAIELREEFEPIFNFYNLHVLPIFGWGVDLAPVAPPAWFPDAYLIAAALFFLFFIAQARIAAAPYPADDAERALRDRRSRLEKAIDWVLPPLACAIGAFLTAPTLLPLLTLPAAVWLAIRRLAGRHCWFRISRSYYINAAMLILLTATILALPPSK